MTIKPIISTTTNTKKISGIAGIRISAGNKPEIIKLIIKNLTKKKFLFPRLAVYTKIYIKKKQIDDGIMIFFEKKKSFTGEDTLEIFTHGTRKITKNIINFCIKKFKRLGIRKAKRGEYIQRAFRNNKIDFIEVQRLAKLLILNKEPKETIKKYNKIREKIKKILNIFFNIQLYIENYINFNTENTKEKNKKLIRDIKENIKRIKNIKKGNILIIKNKINIAIIGHENVGKSSIFNLITKKEKSIISKKRGTTRNKITKKMKLKKNIKYKITDTPGYNKKKGELNKKIREVIKRTIVKSDIILNVINNKKKIKTNKKVINIVNKIDKNKKKIIEGKKMIYTSCYYKTGIKKIKTKIFEKIKKILKVRYLVNKNKTLKLIKKNIYLLNKELKKKNLEIITEKIKNICNLISKLFFLNKKKNIKKEIFRKFCIGK